MGNRTLAQRRIDIERLQDEYRRKAALNVGVIRGAVDTGELGEKIIALQYEYNRRAKTTRYYGGRLEKLTTP